MWLFRACSIGLAAALLTAACGGGSTPGHASPTPEATDSSASPPVQLAGLPAYAHTFDPVSQDKSNPKALVAALLDNYQRSVAAFNAGNGTLSQRYLLYIVGAKGASGDAYQALFTAVNYDSTRVAEAADYQAYLDKLAITYTISKVDSVSPQRIALEVMEHKPAGVDPEAEPVVDEAVSLVFVHQSKGDDPYGARFVVSEDQPH